MKTVGIICEYNPFHLGHQKQFCMIRDTFGADCVIVCLMSGSYVQRGEPAVFDKLVRAEAAIRSGADLVIEMPAVVSLNSAEGFAAGSVAILSRLCDALCFGTESETAQQLMQTAKVLLSDDFPPHLKDALSQGHSFPKAREIALKEMKVDTSTLSRPNNLLALEYCKAILSQNSTLSPFAIQRDGNYHNIRLDSDNPSATSLRLAIAKQQDISAYVPAEAAEIFRRAAPHFLKEGEQAILYRLKTMSEEEFASLPFGSEGLWRKLMHAAQKGNSLSEIFIDVKSKRYTYTRISRMVMCAFLGITQQDMDAPVPYCRILGFTDKGRQLLRNAKEMDFLRNIGEKTNHPYEQSESKWETLYPFFCTEQEQFVTKNKRVYYKP